MNLDENTMEKFKTYTCSYRFDGAEWCAEIKARSHEEAEAIRALEDE